MTQRVLFTFFVSLVVAGVMATGASVEKRQASSLLPIDCSLVLCARPTGCDEEDIFTPPGQCCPICRPDCSAVSCLKPVCEEGEVLETPLGQCCPVCTRPDCAAVLCLAITEEDCDEGETVVVPPGECCAVCQPDCSAVSCLKPVCEEGEVLETPPGQCCPVCTRPDCAAISCLKPVCKKGEVLETPLGECCPVCTRPDCAAVSCLKPVCEEGEVLETPLGQCCPVCTRPDCAAVLCLAITEEDCDEGETVVVPPGECCAVCQPNCSAVSCLKPVCEEGEKLEVPAGECCPVCVEDPCPYKGQEFSFCPGCDSSCIDIINEEPRFCPAVCRPGCSCPGAQLIDTISGGCVPRDECTNPCALVDCAPGSKCKVNRTTNEAYCTEPSCEVNTGGCRKDEICQLDIQIVKCVTTPCPSPLRQVVCLGQREVCSLEPEVGPCEAAIRRYFHNQTSGQCELFIYGGCQGNANNFETLEECQQFCGVQDPCATKKCRAGHRCEIFKPTGEAFCSPDCRLDNGGCSKNEICTLEQVVCVRAPCPPVVQCLAQCPLRCPPGHRCEIFKPTGEAFCTPDCSLDNGGCSKNEICTLEQVVCVRAPCPPVVQCLSPCATVRCRTGHRCEVDEVTGEAFCNPDCSLSNGGCRSDQICELRPVICVRPPCPPEVQCSCPPPCSKAFCAGNPKGICSNPGPREIPGCTGECQLTYCKACIFSRDNVTAPDVSDCPVCSNLDNYSRPSTCYWRWARCVGHRYWRENRPNRRIGEYADEHIICLSPPCPRRG